MYSSTFTVTSAGPFVLVKVIVVFCPLTHAASSLVTLLYMVTRVRELVFIALGTPFVVDETAVISQVQVLSFLQAPATKSRKISRTVFFMNSGLRSV